MRNRNALFTLPLGIAVLLMAGACGSSGKARSEAPPASSASADAGHITFVGENKRLLRVEARPNGRVEDISAGLDALSRKGEDSWVDSSPDGQWLLVETERFDKDCAGYSCLAVVAGDLSSGESVRVNGTNGELLRSSQPGAIGPAGRLIVYPAEGMQGHDLDLWATTLASGVWGPPVRLTGGSPNKFNTSPAISSDGSRVVFSCGEEPYGYNDTAICEVGTDGSAFRTVLSPASRPVGITEAGAFRAPHYEADGSIVFVATWAGSQVWRLVPGAPEPVRIATSDRDESELCVLPDGRLATSWGGQPGFEDYTLIVRVTSRSGTGTVLPASKTKVLPGPLGCSR